jgi:hypothetical protein
MTRSTALLDASGMLLAQLSDAITQFFERHPVRSICVFVCHIVGNDGRDFIIELMTCQIIVVTPAGGGERLDNSIDCKVNIIKPGPPADDWAPRK